MEKKQKRAVAQQSTLLAFVSPFAVLSLDLVFHLATFLDPATLCASALVSQAWRDVWSSDCLWRAIFALKYEALDLQVLAEQPGCTYSIKSLYGVRRKLLELCSNTFDLENAGVSDIRIPFAAQTTTMLLPSIKNFYFEIQDLFQAQVLLLASSQGSILRKTIASELSNLNFAMSENQVSILGFENSESWQNEVLKSVRFSVIHESGFDYPPFNFETIQIGVFSLNQNIAVFHYRYHHFIFCRI